MNGIEETKNENNSIHFSRKVFAEILLLTFILALIGFFLQDKVEKLLTASVEYSVARQTADFSVLAEERFNRELAELRYAAHFLENSETDTAAAFKSLEDLSRKGVTCGLINNEEKSIVGKALSRGEFKQLIRAFSGNNIVDFSAGKGLLFAVPVFSGDNVRYVLYRLYSEEMLYEYFGLEEYDADSRILIRERGGSVIVPYRDFGKQDEAFFEDKNVYEGFKRIREKLNTSRSAAVYSEGKQGRFFLFGADLPQTNCSMIGYVPWEAVAGNISNIYMLVFTVVSLLLLLFAVGSIYLFMLQSQAAETESIKKAKQIADNANKAKSDFLANMSHEIRTPINAVLSMNEMILRESRENDTLNYAQNIAAAGRSLLSLINDILDFSKIESGHMELAEAKYQLSSLLYDVIAIIEPRAKGKSLEFTVNTDETLPNELFGDVIRIRQIMLNLLTNAVKYTHKGKVVFEVGRSKDEREDFALEIKVTDTGIGIKEEDKKKIFADFERLDTVKNKNIEGTGLGMAITKKLIDLMRGSVTLESIYGVGSSFTVVLPQKVVDAAPIGKFTYRLNSASEGGKKYHESFHAPNAKILAVDDNEVNLLVVRNLLKKTELQIDTCKSGEECLQKMQEEPYHIILLDQMMPGIDGIETLKKSKTLENNKCKDTPIIALTANAISGAREMFLAEGFSDYLSKPIIPEKLEAMMKKYLPEELVQSSADINDNSGKNTATAENKGKTDANESAEESNACIDRSLGLLYAGGSEEMYEAVLNLFVESKNEKISKIREAFDTKDWHNYTIMVHALKSSAMTVGAKKLSELAKLLEMAGKKIRAEDSSEEDKNAGIAYINENHEKAMSLYEQTVKEAK